MAKNQTIHCSVSSCRYNKAEQKLCELDSIEVRPNCECHTGACEESMCGSYQNGRK